MAPVVLPAAGTGISVSLDLPGSRGVGGTTGHPISCEGSAEQLGQEFDFGQAPAPSGSGRAEGSMQESRAACLPFASSTVEEEEARRGGRRSSGNLWSSRNSPGLSALGTKGLSQFWETLKISLGKWLQTCSGLGTFFSLWRPGN